MSDHNQVANVYIEGRIRAYALDAYAKLVLGAHDLPVINLALNTQGDLRQFGIRPQQQVMEIVNFPGNTLSCFHGVRAWDECPTCNEMALQQALHENPAYREAMSPRPNNKTVNYTSGHSGGIYGS